MGKHTQYTRAWLERRFRQLAADGLYLAHQPTYGIGHASCEPGHARRHARTFQILRALARLDGDTVLDVGGAEGFVAHCAQSILSYRAMSADLSMEACRRASEMFNIDSAAVSSHRLPFPDDAFDVVMCSEVIEHVESPIETLAELDRVARRAVLLTTEECEPDHASIDAHLFQRCGFPHFERNVFHADDLRALFGPTIELYSQMVGTGLPDSASRDEVVAWIADATRSTGMVDGGVGVVMIAPADDRALRDSPRVDDATILEALVQVHANALPLAPRHRDAFVGLTELAVCPDCHAAIDRATMRCTSCAWGGRIEAGVADLTSALEPDAVDTEQRLDRRWTPDRVVAAMRLRAKLDLPMNSDKRRWDFVSRDERRGWLPNVDLSERADATVGWRFDSSGPTPWLVSPGLGIRGADLHGVRITMRISNPDYDRDAGVGQLFWLTEDDSDFAPSRHLIFPILNDEDVHTYDVPLTDVPGWPVDRDIVCIRFDPANGPCDIELVRFELY